MDALMNAVEVRVVGSLVEKQMATPEYYPLTLNALVNACNQLTGREPVVAYDERTVARALESLREKQLVWQVTAAGARVPKYEHRLSEKFNLAEQETAVLAVLMLRGPQTVGEIKGRTGRMYEFAELTEVEMTLESLMTAEPPLVVKLPRQPGTKESRYAHLLAGEVHVEEQPVEPRAEAAVLEVRAENERLAQLESEVASLRQQLADLQQQFLDFKRQFE
ncbi:MAG TPA: YceH family protein [Blastocatellia bacterium]|nr:YceH family protein [Blastocatellia bacterium]